ncbi:MAG: aggregation factor core [Pseudomonadota bacterium]
MRAVLVLILALAVAGPAHADIEVSFREGAPVDRFLITHRGECPLAAARVTIDLRNSAGELIFDTTAEGAGVEVFQPFRVVRGGGFLLTAPIVMDGAQQVTLDLADMPVGGVIEITTDLDDTLGARAITVSGNEFFGTRLLVGFKGMTRSIGFEDSTTVTVPLDTCR